MAFDFWTIDSKAWKAKNTFYVQVFLHSYIECFSADCAGDGFIFRAYICLLQCRLCWAIAGAL